MAGINAVDAGAVAANTWYSIWSILKEDGTNAGLLHAGGTGVIGDLTLPADYLYARLVGWILTDATSDFLVGYWHDKEFFWDIAIQEFTGNGPATYTDVDCKTSMPPTSYKAYLSLNEDASNPGLIYLRRNGSNEATVSQCTLMNTDCDTANVEINTDSGQIFELKTATAAAMSIYVTGYKWND